MRCTGHQVIICKHLITDTCMLFRSNRNVFTYNERKYRWNYFLLVGATLTLKDVESNEVLAVAKLKPAVQSQAVTAWGLRCVAQP